MSNLLTVTNEQVRNLIEESLSLTTGYSEANVKFEPTAAPSRAVNKINIPEVKNAKATFVYNYFTKDERVRGDSSDEKNRIITLDSSDTNELFFRLSNKKLARYVKLEFQPPRVDPDIIPSISLTKNGVDLTDELGKILVEGAMSNDIFTGVEIIDTGRETNLYNMLNELLFVYELKDTRFSNREKISKLYETLEEKGGLFGEDKKILLEAYRNIPPTTKSGGYLLAQSDVHPELAKSSNDPLGKQSFSVQFNNLLMSETINEATSIPDNVFQDELRAMREFAAEAREEIFATRGDFTNSFDEVDYELLVQEISHVPLPEGLTVEDLAATGKYPAIMFAGYLIEKYEVLPNENVKFVGRKYVDQVSATYAIDDNVRYGGSYFYKIRTVCQVVAILASENQSDPLLNQNILGKFYIASEGEIVDVYCFENIPPPPPSNFRVKFNFETLLPRINWGFPLNKQRDIKRFQVFKRLTTSEPFTLIAEYNFDNSEIKSPVSEVALSDNLYVSPTPVLHHVDTTHKEGEKPIYAVASVDARGLSSNYSPQIMVERDRYTNQTSHTIISRRNAPKPYPNLFLNQDTFQDCIKTSGYDRIKMVFDPEYFKVLKTIKAEDGSTHEQDLNFLQIQNDEDTNAENFKYKFHFINIDNQLDQTVSVKIQTKASPADAAEGMFTTSTAKFSEKNVSFQYGIE